MLPADFLPRRRRLCPCSLDNPGAMACCGQKPSCSPNASLVPTATQLARTCFSPRKGEHRALLDAERAARLGARVAAGAEPPPKKRESAALVATCAWIAEGCGVTNQGGCVAGLHIASWLVAAILLWCMTACCLSQRMVVVQCLLLCRGRQEDEQEQGAVQEQGQEEAEEVVEGQEEQKGGCSAQHARIR